MTRIVVAGVGRFTDRNYEFPKALSPVEMCAEACRRAERDTGRDGILKDVVAIGTYHGKKKTFSIHDSIFPHRYDTFVLRNAISSETVAQ